MSRILFSIISLFIILLAMIPGLIIFIITTAMKISGEIHESMDEWEEDSRKIKNGRQQKRTN